MDLFTREIVGVNFSRFHNQELVLGALNDALTKHDKPEILHSGQGSEYDCQKYTRLADVIGIKISMSAKSSPWENGYQESFYSNFKLELGETNRFETVGELVEEICKVILYYNTRRIHTSLKMPPEEFKRKYQLKDVDKLS